MPAVDAMRLKCRFGSQGARVRPNVSSTKRTMFRTLEGAQQ